MPNAVYNLLVEVQVLVAERFARQCGLCGVDSLLLGTVVSEADLPLVHVVVDASSPCGVAFRQFVGVVPTTSLAL